MIAFLSSVWTTVLYQPLFNALIWIYENIANYNLGWSVIWLTIFLRIILLPLTILSERNALLQEKAVAEAQTVLQSYKNDRVAQREVMRKIIKKYHLSPWAKVLQLAIQLLVLVLLYQVFIRGITGDRLAKILYPFIDFPGRINIYFYGFNIGKLHDTLWSGIAAVYLFFSILIENRSKKKWTQSDLLFQFMFPVFTFGILWILPMVKSLFILTTMVFSDIITLSRHLLFKPKKADDHGAGGHH